MKKVLLLILSTFCLGACSVDSFEIEQNEPQVTALNSSVEVNGCSLTTFDYGDAGKIEIWNDLESVYVKIVAEGDFSLIRSNIHIAEVISDFPTIGNGSINLNKMDYKKSFKPAVQEYTYTFPLNSFGNSFLVASYAEFEMDHRKYDFWAGDVHSNDWSYFEYNLNGDHPNAGADHSLKITLSAAQAVSSWDEVRKLFTSMLDPGVPEGQFVGSFEPSIDEIIKKFQSSEGGVGTYTTEYTIGEGECTDSVILSLYVVPDDEV